MTRAKTKKKETYYQRWMRGKRKMTLIMKEEEFEAIKKFCDENRMSYREFFVSVAPRLLIENRELKKALEAKESEYNAVVEENGELKATVEELRKALEEKETRVNDLEAEYNSLKEAYESLKSEHEALKEKLAEAEAELDEKESELQEDKKVLSDLQARLKSAEAEAKDLKEVLEIIVSEGTVEVPVEHCGRLKKFGFRPVQKGVGFMKKVVCTNSEELV